MRSISIIYAGQDIPVFIIMHGFVIIDKKIN